MSVPDSGYLEAQLAWMGTLARRIAQMRVVIDAARVVLGDYDPCGEALPALKDALRDYDAGLPPDDPDEWTLPVRWMALAEAKGLYDEPA